jgi:hypothetical protein
LDQNLIDYNEFVRLIVIGSNDRSNVGPN